MCQACKMIELLENTDTDNEHELFAIIRRICYKEGVKNGSIISNEYELNFCPECGKRIKIKNNFEKWKEIKKKEIEDLDIEAVVEIESDDMKDCTWCKEYAENSHCCDFLANRGKHNCKEYIKEYLEEELK